MAMKNKPVEVQIQIYTDSPTANKVRPWSSLQQCAIRHCSQHDEWLPWDFEPPVINELTHLPVVPHIYIYVYIYIYIYTSMNQVSIGSGNELSPSRRQAII